VRCVEDVLKRIGDVKLEALRVIITGNTSHGSEDGHLISGLNWFNVVDEKVATFISLTLSGDEDLRPSSVRIRRYLQRLNTGRFSLVEPSVTGDGSGRVDASAAVSSARGTNYVSLDLSIPEWTFDAGAWVVAIALNAVGTVRPGLASLTICVAPHS
jgi:hypothetical protein